MSEARHAVVVYIPEGDLLTLLRDWRHQDFVALPDLKACRDSEGRRREIPPDAVLERVCHAWDRRAFGLLFSHPSFPACGEGEQPECWYLTEVTVNVVESAVRPDGVVETEGKQ